ncbi:MAG: HAMP domain-containing sensor histidine kinase [Chloroflexota bacterium]|nr:HAMP domain-containing sensor histidine kinase [Chloroflexota bacterium]
MPLDLISSLSDPLAQAIVQGFTEPILVVDLGSQLVSMNMPAISALEQPLDDGTLEQIMNASRLGTPWQATNGQTYQPRLISFEMGWIILMRDMTQISKMSRNQNEFVRVVSHDLRSPLTSIQGFAGMLGAAGPLNERQTHYVEKILSGITQMAALVENIQDAGRFDPETGFYEMARTACDMGALVERVAQNYLVPAEKQELKLTVDIIEPLPIVNADGLMLERAVTNLIDNAIKYTPNGGEIRVRVTIEDRALVIAVHDTGYGINAEDQKLLFQRHVRLMRKEHQRKVKGSGLGLFIVRSVAQRHNGSAWVESIEGQGSTFYLRIPLSDANLIAPR